MSFTYKFCLFLIALAIVSAYFGFQKGQPNRVEQVFLQSTHKVEKLPIKPTGHVAMLQEVMRLSNHELTESAEMKSNDGWSQDKIDQRLDDDNYLLNQVFKIVRQNKRLTDTDEGSIPPAQLIREILEHDLKERPMGRYVLAGVFAFLAIAIFTFKKLNLRRRTKERVIHSLFLVTATSSILILFLIMMFLFIEGMPVFHAVNPLDFLFGSDWYPTEEPPALGIMPLIMGSFAVTLVSSVIAIPLGVMTALYISEIAPPKVRSIVKPMVEMLEALPSVVIGFFGMVVVAPFLQDFLGVPTGLNLFNASIMLAFMAVPTITSLSEDAIYSVPQELKEASLALGATHWQSIWKVIVPASLSGITTAIILGMARSIGETMVVLMVAGGAALIPTSLFDPVRPMPASIAAEMAEAPFHSEHYYALFAIGMVLFLFTLMFNLVADHVSHKYKQTGSATL